MATQDDNYSWLAMSKSQAKKLPEFFHVPVELFI
jgi:hypothetical protein